MSKITKIRYGRHIMDISEAPAKVIIWIKVRISLIALEEHFFKVIDHSSCLYFSSKKQFWSDTPQKQLWRQFSTQWYLFSRTIFWQKSFFITSRKDGTFHNYFNSIQFLVFKSKKIFFWNAGKFASIGIYLTNHVGGYELIRKNYRFSV